ncbi:MAG TPA: hypothetical protein VFI00_10490, partial [Kribbella sp.]|nr:hypothetical protein [Kribbella sp.]
VAAMNRTDPSNWASGGQSVLFAGCTVFAVAVSIVACRKMIDALGIELRTKLPRRRVRVPVAAVRVAAVTPVSKESAARAKPLQVVEPPPPPPDDEETISLLVPPPPRMVDLDEARPVGSLGQSSGHADRLSPRPRRTSVRRNNKPGRRPGS